MSYPYEHGMQKSRTVNTADPKTALINITTRNCRKIHTIADLMTKVVEVKKMPEFESARTPEELDAIMEHLVYMLNCEANCGIGLVSSLRDGHPVEMLDYIGEKPADPNGSKESRD